tara:strand:- start:13870 stop:14484 length:615 start_codon:yes stop_codon:yes gene_type:complete
MKVGVLDYGVGNVGSLANMIKYINLKPSLSNSVKDLSDNNVIFIPGVGTYDKAMSAISCNNNIEAIKDFISQKDKYIVGICLGMQILFNSSEEGSSKGIGLLNDEIRSFRGSGVNQVPHMGWNTIESNLLPFSVEKYNRFYFCHSYFCPVLNFECPHAKTNYEIDFTSLIVKDNIIGIQFHPEKSGLNGANFLKDLLNNIPNNA